MFKPLTFLEATGVTNAFMKKLVEVLSYPWLLLPYLAPCVTKLRNDSKVGMFSSSHMDVLKGDTMSSNPDCRVFKYWSFCLSCSKRGVSEGRQV